MRCQKTWSKRSNVRNSEKLEAVVLSDPYFIERKLFPNVDFYSGIIYKAMGFPVEMFTVLFALGRLPGWIAQWKEMMDDKHPIGRPRQIYTGPVSRDFVSMEKRSQMNTFSGQGLWREVLVPIHLQGKIKMDSKNGLRPARFCTVFFSQVTKGNTTFCDVHLLFVCVFLLPNFIVFQLKIQAVVLVNMIATKVVAIDESRPLFICNSTEIVDGSFVSTIRLDIMVGVYFL